MEPPATISILALATAAYRPVANAQHTTEGTGDTVQSCFFSPKSSDPIWGVGPVFLIPTATDDALGGEPWGADPTTVVLKQNGA